MDVIKARFSASISCSIRPFYRSGDRGVFLKEEFPWQGKRKTNGHTEKGGKEAFCRSLEEREETCPDFKDEFGHWEGDTIVGKKSQVQL